MGPSRQKTLSEREEEVKEEYLKTLQDLTFNSKPLIDVLTEVADENREYAACIVDCIEEQLDRVCGPLKLPILYLIDSIIKCEAIKQYYLPLFSRNIHRLFTKVYELGDENVRSKLAKLRFTWNGVLPVETLAALDNLVRSVNPSWQTAPPPAVHVNPKFISAGVNAANVAKLNSMATKEELRQKQKELFELTQRKQELEQELKVLRPVKGAKWTEKLTNVVNQVLTQVEQVKSGTYNPLEVQRVRGSAGAVKNSMRNIIESIHSDPKHASYANDLPFLNELVSKLTETEKILAELEKSNQCKRKVILVDKDSNSSLHKSAELQQPHFAPNPATTQSTRPNMAIRSWNKNSQTNVNGNLTLQNPPAFRIAPVSSLLINAARRARDPRLQKKINVPAQKKVPTTESSGVVNGRLETTEPAASRIIESKNDKQNESPDQSNVAQAVMLKKNEVSPKSRSASRKVVANLESTSTSEENMPSPKKRKVEKVVEASPVAKSETSSQKEETHHSRKRRAELDNGNHKNKSNTPSPEKRKSNGSSSNKRTSEASKKSKTTLSSTIDDLFEDAPKKHESNVSKTFSKEERDKRLRILVQTPNEETQRMLESLKKNSPKMAEKLIRLLSKEKETSQMSPVVDVDADSGTESETAKTPPSKESKPELEDDDSGDLDCVIVSSPEPAKVFEKMESPPKIEAVDEYDPFGELLDLDESILPADEPKDEPTIEVAARSPPIQDVDLRSLMGPGMMPSVTAPTSVMMPPVTGAGSVMIPPVTAAIMPPVSAPVMVPAGVCKSPPSAPPPPPIFPFMGLNMDFGFPKPPGFGIITPPNTILEVPHANEDIMEIIDRDPMTTINIDSVPRQIRHYGPTAVVFINWDEPRQILFSSHDVPRRIVVNNKISVQCLLNSPDVECLVYGKPHKFRLGAPTRELYIDGIGYECYFGGPPIKVRLEGRYVSVRIEGQAPKVDIGPKRLDLVVGKIDMIINEVHTFPVFLDAKPQKIEVEGYKFVIVFIDSLQRVMINDITFRTDFTGFSQSFRHCNKIFNFRFSMLPRGIIPGAVNIHQMRTSKLPSPPPLPPSLRYSTGEDFAGMPVPPVMTNVPIIPVSTIPTPVMMNCAEPAVALNSESASVTTDPHSLSTAVKEEDGNQEELSIDELVKELLAKGLVHLPDASTAEKDASPSTSKTTKASETTKTEIEANVFKSEPVKPVDLCVSDTLKQKQPGMISILYTGNQCGSCGLRFPEEQTLKYSEHLDWHFRLNRRGKDGARTIHSRKWYYNANDWLKFQEMEDESDRGASWFDNHPATEYTEEVIEQVPCIAASRDGQDSCELCRDRFEQFYNEETEEWQLRNAIRIDDKIYHPICHQDHTDHNDQSDDVEEIIDTTETINLDDPSMNEDESNNVTVDEEASTVNTELPDTLSIKQEKPDVPSDSEKPKTTNDGESTAVSTEEQEGKPMDEEDDSDVEEVQLIEEPIEEIIIPDDANDGEESNLETLLVEDLVVSQSSELEDAAAQDPPVEETVDKIVDITQSVSTVSIDGNVEPGDTMQQHLITGPTKIKITIAKSHTEDRTSNVNEGTPKSSPKSSPKNITNDDAESLDKVSEFSESADFDEQPPPPGEEMVTLVPADLKPRLRERNLTEYPPVRKGVGDSGLCSIM